MDKPRLHKIIRSATDLTTALAVGLKMDPDALPASLAQAIRNGSVNLKSPDTTVARLKLSAAESLFGRVETVNGKDTFTRVG